MAHGTKRELDIAQYVREPTVVSGVPEKLEDPDTIRDVVTW